MGYELNSEAYSLFAKIEVALREFLIDLIKKKGITEWTKKFLGKIHLESLKEIGKRIYLASENQLNPEIEDVYISKIYRELKKDSFGGSTLLHPFYYLNWSDFIGVIGKSQNSEIIRNSIGDRNLDILLQNLKSLNFLRNDVAHSRFISNEDLLFIKSAYNQIAIAIPNFLSLTQVQYHEESIGFLFDSLLMKISEIETENMVSVNTADELENLVTKLIDSFWVNSFFIDILELIKQLQNEIMLYKRFRKSPGGLLPIQQWKQKNSILLSTIKNSIHERKIPY